MSRRAADGAPFCSVQHDHWGAARTAIPGRWSEALIVVDLDWWAEEVKRRARGSLFARQLPSDAELSAEWGGVPLTTVNRYVQRWLASLAKDHPARVLRAELRVRFNHTPARRDRGGVAEGSRRGRGASNADTSGEVEGSRRGRGGVAEGSGQNLSSSTPRARAPSPRAFDPGSWIQDDDDARPREEPVLRALLEHEPRGEAGGEEPPLPPSDALLVVQWAARSGDPDARRLRDEHRARRVPVRWSRAWIFGAAVVEGRLSQARAWADGGRVTADDAFLPAEERARADAAFGPWIAPGGWTWGPAVYAALTTRAVHLADAARGRGGAARAARADLRLFVDAGWSSHATPPEARPSEQLAAPERPWPEALWAQVRDAALVKLATIVDGRFHHAEMEDLLCELWAARVGGVEGQVVKVHAGHLVHQHLTALVDDVLARHVRLLPAEPPSAPPDEHPDPLVAGVLAALGRRSPAR